MPWSMRQSAIEFCLDNNMMASQLGNIQLLLAKSHDLAGLADLALGLFAMAVPKQGIGHRRSGRLAMRLPWRFNRSCARIAAGLSAA